MLKLPVEESPLFKSRIFKLVRLTSVTLESMHTVTRADCFGHQSAPAGPPDLRVLIERRIDDLR